MKVVGLISGGKDSCFNLMHCVQNGHQIVALANLMPEEKDELDSFMFQTVGHDVISVYSQALGLPLYRRTIKGSSVNINADYCQQKGDEVEDLFEILKEIKEAIDFDAVSSGAILSNYQRVRVENVCQRLGLQSLAYLWQRKQEELLEEMIQSNLTAILIKVASLGLTEKHLGKTLEEMQPHLMKMKEKFGLNVCGEGGEYETLVLDCPLFVKKIVIDEMIPVIHSNDAFAPVVYLKFKSLHLEDKHDVDPTSTLNERLKGTIISIPLLLDDELQSFDVGQKVEKSDGIGKNGSLQRNGCSSNDSIITPKFNEDKIMFAPTLNENKDKSFSWCCQIVCEKSTSESIEESSEKTLLHFKDLIRKNGYQCTDVSLVHLFCLNMDNFAKINSVYSKLFPANPPARVCVEACLPDTQQFRLDANLSKTHKRAALHVQSISYWAPANIGPYSQSVKIHSQTKRIYFSGSIAMRPCTMKVIESGFVSEAILSLKHVNEVSKITAYERDTHEQHGLVTCYVTDVKFMDIARKIFRNQQDYFPSSCYQLNVVCVPRLPRNAKVEWHVNMRVIETNEEAEDDTCSERLDDQVDESFKLLRIFGSDALNIDSLQKKLNNNNTSHNAYFCRVFFVRSIVQDEEALVKVLRQSFALVGNESIAVSFVPVESIIDNASVVLVFET